MIFINHCKEIWQMLYNNYLRYYYLSLTSIFQRAKESSKCLATDSMHPQQDMEKLHICLLCPTTCQKKNYSVTIEDFKVRSKLTPHLEPWSEWICSTHFSNKKSQALTQAALFKCPSGYALKLAASEEIPLVVNFFNILFLPCSAQFNCYR